MRCERRAQANHIRLGRGALRGAGLWRALTKRFGAGCQKQ